MRKSQFVRPWHDHGSASEAATMILRIDDVIASKGFKGGEGRPPGPPGGMPGGEEY